MSITKKLPVGNSSVTKPPNNTAKLGSGNIIPHWWYKKIKAAGDKPDLVAITILSELWFLYRKSSGNEFNDGYTYFERKFEFTRAQLQDATLRLHESGIVTRSFRTVVVNGRNFSNELHLQLNLNALLALMPAGNSVHSDNDGDNDIQADDVSGSSTNDEEKVFYGKLLGNSISASSEKCIDHIKHRKISLRKNRSSRSIESSIFKNSFLGLARDKSDLASFYPLAQSDIALMQASSGRDFTLTAINEILLKLSKKHPQHRFPNKEAFMSYMGKVLYYEMRDAVQISSVDFKLNCNRDKQEIAQQHYLEEVEYSRDTSSVAQLRRKLAAVFEPRIAYQLLKAARIKDVSGLKLNDQLPSSFTIELERALDLTYIQQQILLEQVRAVFGNHINKVDMVSVNKPNSFVNPHTNYNSDTKSTLINNTIMEKAEPAQDLGIWGKIRSMLVSYYGEDGRAIDSNWFAKLEPQINDADRSLVLKAPSEFIKEWVQAKYSSLIEKFAQGQNYNLIGVSC